MPTPSLPFVATTLADRGSAWRNAVQPPTLNHANGVAAYQPGVTPREDHHQIPLLPCKRREHADPHASPPPAHRHLAVRSTPPRPKATPEHFRHVPRPSGDDRQ